MSRLNITDILTEHAARRPDHPAIDDRGYSVTYAELDRLVDAAAANLRAAGLVTGDIAGVMLPDSAEHLVLLLALARLGVVMVAIDGFLPPPERRKAAVAAGARTVIAMPGTAPVGDTSMLTLDTICRPSSGAFERPPLGPDHPLMIVQSSGTTGLPKSFVWSHARMAVQAPRHQRCLGLTWQDRYLAVVKMSFFWEREICLVMLCLGATIVVNRARTLAELVAHIRTGRITTLALTPAHLAALLDHPADTEPLLPTVRAMVVGSAPLTHERRLQVRRKLTPNFYEQLGANEAGLLILGSPADQDARPAAIGRVVDGVEARIVGEDGRPLPAGEVGLVGFRGEGFPAAYLDDAAATARAFRDGWFYPGDLAAIDADGFFHFKGRADDVINNEGAKFYPIEVEKLLLAHPAVAEAAVFGWPDPERGEVAVAYIVARHGFDAEALGTWCRERIAGYKVPRWCVTVDQLPRNPTGKVLKRRLKEAFRAARAQAEGAG